MITLPLPNTLNFEVSINTIDRVQLIPKERKFILGSIGHCEELTEVCRIA